MYYHTTLQLSPSWKCSLTELTEVRESDEVEMPFPLNLPISSCEISTTI